IPMAEQQNLQDPANVARVIVFATQVPPESALQEVIITTMTETSWPSIKEEKTMSIITLLGTGTCQIEVERRASSVLLDLEGTYVLFDCGHGVVQRLLEAGVGHNQLEHIVLSHFHPDHVSDIIPFLQAGAWSQRDPRTTDIHIYGPAGV